MNFPIRLPMFVGIRYCSTGRQKQIGKVLIANRGEIACRVIRTAKKLGIKSVAVFSDPDVNSLHVQMADEAIHIGPAASRLSYLNYEKILEVSSRLGVDAIHPGYGFLSESVEFADACAQTGVIFIGPSSSAIRDMGIKSISKSIMAAAGVPIIPGYHGEDQSTERLKQEAEKIGYPVMLKAVRGGGGKGMRIVQSESEFEAMLESAKSEAKKAFNNDEMLIEKFVVKPRHVEVQVLCDGHGNGVHLFERDCSVQRRHQKIIEEAPAPGLPREIAERLGQVAVRAAKAVNYVGAGTVEFVMDEAFNFYFMEMNTRLQVEHPITEMITGQDLVQWQFKVAEGSKLPMTQDQIQVNGHSFEARIYAEDPDNNFMPGAGVLERLVAPQHVPDEVRIETGVTEGDEVTVHYDPLIAKLVVWAQDRNLALRKLSSCLDSYQILGLKTNIAFLKSLATHDAFVRGDVNTDFIPDHYDSLFQKDHTLEKSGSGQQQVLQESVCKACLAVIQSRRITTDESGLTSRGSPWSVLKNFRVNAEATEETLKLRLSGEKETVCPLVTFKSNGNFDISFNGVSTPCEILPQTQSTDDNRFTIRCKIGDHISSFGFNHSTDGLVSILPNESSEIIEFTLEPVQKIAGSDDASKSSEKAALAPMTGIIDKIMVKVGDVIKKNDPLVVMTAMKMEYIIKAPVDGTVEAVMFKDGDTVNRHATIVDLHPLVPS
ncbi:methylcrotonoyl-CoA carboxylase subunit alpha, mitochondrial-like isoform X2 [Convolutriloba macropyga]